jgi:hypothetical protein
MINQYLDNVCEDAWKEEPVDILTFIEDDYFIGKSTRRGCMVYPYWKKFLKNIFSNKSSIKNILLTDPIGTGKTFVSSICASYIIYKTLCLKDPIKSFGLCGEHLSMTFIKPTSDTTTAFQTFKHMICDSPWFSENCNIKKSFNTYILNEIVEVSQMSYSKTNDYPANTIFMYIDYAPKINDSDYSDSLYQYLSKICYEYRTGVIVETSYTEGTAKFHEEFNNCVSVDKFKRYLKVSDPQWVIKPKDFFPDSTFIVAYNSQQTKIINTFEDLDVFEDTASFIKVPVNFKYLFEKDAEYALKIVGGITPTKRIKLFGRSFTTAFEYLQNDRLIDVVISLGDKKFFKNNYNKILCENKYSIKEVDSFTIEQIQSNDWTIQYPIKFD